MHVVLTVLVIVFMPVVVIVAMRFERTALALRQERHTRGFRDRDDARAGTEGLERLMQKSF